MTPDFIIFFEIFHLSLDFLTRGNYFGQQSPRRDTNSGSPRRIGCTGTLVGFRYATLMRFIDQGRETIKC